MTTATITRVRDLTPATAETMAALQPGDLLTLRSPCARNSRTVLVAEVERSRTGNFVWVTGRYATRFGSVSGRRVTRGVFIDSDLIAVVPAAELEIVSTYRDGRPLRVARKAV